MQSPYRHSQSAKAHAGNLNVKDLEEGSFSCTQDKLLRCAMAASDNVFILKSAANFPADILENRKGSLNGGSSEVPVKNLSKSASKTGKNGTEPSDDALECLNQTIQIKKLNESESSDIQDPPLQPGSGDEGDESDIVLHDVKVCDICGDAGREYLLAICSRCSDGAEHTYCMKQMLDKVPAGIWLCEECKFVGATEKQMQSELEMVDRIEKNSSECPNSVNGNLSKDSDVEVKLSGNLALDINRTEKLNQSSQVIRKSHSYNIEAAPLAKRRVLEKIAGSRKASSPNRTATLPCDWSLKSLDKGKVKPSYQVSSVPQYTKKVAETAGSAAARRLQTPRGTLLKSYSFNTTSPQPKVKLFDEPILQKEKGAMSPVKALDMKEGPSRLMGKSMSLKSTSFSHADATDVKTKLLPNRVSHAQEYKGLKRAKERNNLSQFDNPVISTSSSALSGLNGDQKSKSRGEASFKNRDFNAFHSDGNSNSLLKPVSHLTCEGSEILVKASTSGICKSAEQKPSQVSPRDESLSSSFTAEGMVNVCSTLPDGLPELRESPNQVDKTRDNFCINSRQSITSGGKGVFCQDSKEIGHVSEISSVGDSRISVADASCTRNSREQIEKGSRLKAAIEAAMMRKPGIRRLNKLSIPYDDISVSSRELKCDTASQDQSSVPCHQKNMISSEGMGGDQAILQSCVSESHKQPKVTEIKLSDNVGDPNSNILSDGKIGTGDLHKHDPVSALVPSKISAIPEHEYIWQGGFEVHRTGKFADLCGGVQAHLSTCASPKVLEVVHKFPENVSLNEVARLSTWPTDFLDRGANDDNIALYFFAKDFESYERNYKCLLDHMMKNDLALKGKFDGIELLIFPSIHLPERSQRWNMLFFLWGVFRGKRTSCLDDILGSLKKLPMPGLSAAHLCSHAAVISMPQTSHKDRDSSASKQSCSVGLESHSLTEVKLPAEKLHQNCDTESVIDQLHLKLIENLEQQDHGPELRIPTDNVLAGPETRCTVNSRKDQNDPDCRLERHHQPSRRPADTVNTSVDITVDSVRDEGKFERNVMEEESVETEAAAERCTLTSTLDLKDRNGLQLRKRMCVVSAEMAPQTSAGSGHAIEQNEENGTLEEGVLSKELNTSSKEMYGSYSYSNANSLGDHFASSRGENYHLREDNSPGTFDQIDNPVKVTSERRFFPIDLGSVDDFQYVDKSVVPWKVLPLADEEHLELELALGAEKKPEKQERLPFFLGLVDKNNHGNKSADAMEVEDDGEDMSASLSLSLSFPFDKDRAVKPISKSDQLLPERHHVNTSLLLFGGYHKV